VLWWYGNETEERDNDRGDTCSTTDGRCSGIGGLSVTGLIEVSEGRQAGKWAREIGGRAGPGGLRAAQEDDEEEDLDDDDEDLNDEDLDDEDLDDEDDDEEDAGDEGEEEDPVRTGNRTTGVAAPR
jgi:hypothetical protein